MSTRERLREYKVFGEPTIDAVDRAQWQDEYGFRELADWYGVAGGPSRRRDERTGRPVEYLHIMPNVEHDPSRARVLHSGMATQLTEVSAMKAMRLFEADPGTQLIMFGNPGGIGRPAGKVALHELRRVWHGDFSPLNEPGVRLLGKLGVHTAEQIGYSYGADKAANATVVCAAHGIDVPKQVLLDPASTVDRGLRRLFNAFQSGGASLDRYAGTAGPPMLEARTLAQTSFLSRRSGLLRATNIAIAHTLATPTFSNRVSAAMAAQPTLRSVIAWGDQSELADNGALTAVTQDLRAKYGRDRIDSFVIPGMHHAGGEDIDLHTAMVLEGLDRSAAMART
jgi:hypothetical protein